MHVYYAFSVSHFISSVGADAGFAAIIGLAILVLLYFAQARETSTLRHEASAASERVQELERRVTQLGLIQRAASGPQSAGAVRNAAAGVPAARAPAAAPLAGVVPAPPGAAPQLPEIPAAPAGVGAPALIDATRLIPVREPSVAALATPPPVTAAAAGQSSVPGPGGQPAPVPAGPPAAGSNGTGDHPQSAPPPLTPLPRVQIRPSGEVPPGGSLLGSVGTQSARRRWLPALFGLLVIGAAVAALLVVTSGSGNSPRSRTAQTTNAPPPVAFNPAKVTVAVLNGTDVNQLAHHVALKLTGSGYREGTIATAADQTHTQTIVGYLSGYRSDAAHVATSLKLPSKAVQPADQSARAVACPPPAACHANVIVTVGSDLSSTP